MNNLKLLFFGLESRLQVFDQNSCCLGVLCVFTLSFGWGIQAQESPYETDKLIELDEIILVAEEKLSPQDQFKPLSTLDAYLEEASKVQMIKRGAYAWEPYLNDMSSERLALSIDGMLIFGACTDKMDPITSYVDISNLQEVRIRSGQNGAEHNSTIGGAMDLSLKKGKFEEASWNAGLDTGFESNAEARIISAEFNTNQESFYFNGDISYRKAGNYTAGGGEEVLYSQYEKYNVSAISGFRLDKQNALEGSFIFDQANDVGYPALPMDVSLARAVIGSVALIQVFEEGTRTSAEHKLYANSVTHVMDDSNRPDVPIRMDMPGWTDTAGFYSKATYQTESHRLSYNLNGYYNRSKAEMTMYPENEEEKAMFMLTWPDLRTFHAGLFLEDQFTMDSHVFSVSARFSGQHERVADEMGLESLGIFYPDFDGQQQRFLYNLALGYQKEMGASQLKMSVGYGNRAPSVSEGYGFYLYNSNDNHDYIGNPYLTPESAAEFNLNVKHKKNKIEFGLDFSSFLFSDYVVGILDPSLAPMTIGAEGVKVYEGIPNALMLNTGLDLSYRIANAFRLRGRASYHFGEDDQGQGLPFIAPIQYGVALAYNNGKYNASLDMRGAGDQKQSNSRYGETAASSYTVFGLNGGGIFYFGDQKLAVKAGVENIFDRFYSTFADWNGIPRPGRNVFFNLTYFIE